VSDKSRRRPEFEASRASATFRAACGFFFDLFRASQAAFFQFQTQALSNAIALLEARIRLDLRDHEQ
jgi:hypothetical protein